MLSLSLLLPQLLWLGFGGKLCLSPARNRLGPWLSGGGNRSSWERLSLYSSSLVLAARGVTGNF